MSFLTNTKPNTPAIIQIMYTDKPHILLLHGALGCKDQLVPLENLLTDVFEVHNINFSGHGGEPFRGPFTPQQFVSEIIGYANEKQLQEFYVFGYSMGGYMALCTSLQFPERVKAIATYGTKLIWNPEVAERESKMANPDKIMEKVPAFAETLKNRHLLNDWKEVLKYTVELMQHLAKNPPLNENTFPKITTPCILCSGDADEVVSTQETRLVAGWIPQAETYVFTNTRHPIEKIDLGQLTSIIKKMLS